MATTIQEFTIKTGPGRVGKYPWNTWENGQIWRAVQGEDFDHSVSSFAAVLRHRAYDRGLRVKTRRCLAAGAVEFQFLPLSAGVGSQAKEVRTPTIHIA